MVGDVEDAGGPLTRCVMDDAADAGRHRGWLGTRRKQVERNQRGSCMTWQTRRGVVDVVGGWGHRGRGWGVIDMGRA